MHDVELKFRVEEINKRIKTLELYKKKIKKLDKLTKDYNIEWDVIGMVEFYLSINEPKEGIEWIDRIINRLESDKNE